MEQQDVYTETKLETAILNNLQRFIMEMGRGFCFEHRQKRILIDQDYFKADLIFYHRILKCHVIIDLKIDRFRHEYASQLNLYMNYYKHEVMQEDDNPPRWNTALYRLWRDNRTICYRRTFAEPLREQVSSATAF